MNNSSPPKPAKAQWLELLSCFFSAWTWRMAWRDSRTKRKRLLLFSTSIVLGIAALTAIGSLGVNLRQAIDDQARALLGADLALSSRSPFSPEQEALFKELGGEQAREISFSSMVNFTRTEGTRLVLVRAVQGDFPFYGELETEPPGAAQAFRRGAGALVEGSLLLQFDSKVGDTIRLGDLTLPIAGELKKVPGETAALATIAPRVYVPMQEIEKSGLLREGSLARYKAYFKFNSQTNVSELVTRLKRRLETLRLGSETVEQRKRDLGRAIDNLYHFLNLVGFIALLLGGMGVASAIHAHVKEKLGTVAVLRCLGGSVAQTFSIYLAQGMALGAFGAVSGAALGILLQAALPRALADFIPFHFDFHTSWTAVLSAVSVGFAVCFLFALLPLLAVRRVSPLAALRVAPGEAAALRDPLQWLVAALLAAGVAGFVISQSRNWRLGVGFSLGLGAAFVLLIITAKALVFLTRKFVPAGLPFALRQGLNNLHRPNNSTLLLLLSLGLGTFLMVSLYLVQHTLLTQLISTSANQGNAVLFDIQPDQRDGVAKLIRTLNLPVLDEAPMITMRISSVKGRPVEELLKEKHVRRWTLRREYRSTYADHLRDSEKIIAGQWIPRAPAGAKVAPISLEQGIAKELGVGLGDEIVFDVQGVPVTTKVASLREVDWRRLQPNFFVLFPRGVLESAPAMDVFVTRVGSAAESARMQRELVKSFPNISVIDLTLVLQTLDSIIGKITFVIRFMTMFTVLTGLLVLAGALVGGRNQRIRESTLLRTLGASRRQIFSILVVEYLSLGFLASLTGILLAFAGAAALSTFVFHMRLAPQLLPLLAALVIVPALTTIIGLMMSRGVLNHPPLAVLRAEVAA